MKRTLLQRLLSWLGFNSFKPPSPPPPEPSSPPQMFSWYKLFNITITMRFRGNLRYRLWIVSSQYILHFVFWCVSSRDLGKVTSWKRRLFFRKPEFSRLCFRFSLSKLLNFVESEVPFFAFFQSPNQFQTFEYFFWFLSFFFSKFLPYKKMRTIFLGSRFFPAIWTGSLKVYQWQMRENPL